MKRYVTDHGLDLPEFAAFPLLDDEHGRDVPLLADPAGH